MVKLVYPTEGAPLGCIDCLSAPFLAHQNHLLDCAEGPRQRGAGVFSGAAPRGLDSRWQPRTDLFSAIVFTLVASEVVNLKIDYILRLRPCRSHHRTTKPCRMTPVGGRRDSKNSANTLNPKVASLCINEGPHELNRRSNFAWAKKAISRFKRSLDSFDYPSLSLAPSFRPHTNRAM